MEDTSDKQLGGDHGLGSRVNGIEFRLASHAIDHGDLERLRN